MTDYIGHIVRFDDDWGLGQIDAKTIKRMIAAGRSIGLTFTLAKRVTALDDITLEERTIKAARGHLFVYPSDSRALTDFWLEVDEDREGRHDGIQ